MRPAAGDILFRQDPAPSGRSLDLSTPLPPSRVRSIFRTLQEANPEPRGELDYTNAYTLLVAVVLSAQATDIGVNRATSALFREVQSPAAMLALGEAALIEHIRTIGLFRNKARHVLALSRILVEEHGGEVPQDRAALERLPGVGRKTANVVLNIWFGEPTIAVDTHVFRVANRTGLAPGATPAAVEAGLLARVPKAYRQHAHHWLILHGRHVCKARKPGCDSCRIAADCAYARANR